ncbi:12758_t:CDS:2, partial [Acaulospora colombiana]
LKIKVAKLSCDFEEIKSKGTITDSLEQLSISEKKIVSVSTEMENSSVTPEQIDLQTEDVLASDISDDTSNSDDISTKEILPLNESQPDKEEAWRYVTKYSDLFRVAMKIRQKESLCWYYYYKAYENRVSNVKTANNSGASTKAHIDDQSARTIVYNEIKSLLPDITDVNLRKITSRAKKVYILYEGIGIDKISQKTYSASAISSLKDIQIQNIINDFPKTTDMSCQAQSAISSEIKVIGVTNCHAHMSDLSSSNDSSVPLTARNR